MGFEEGGLTYSTEKTSTNQYGTPPELIRKLETALGSQFDLDPCSGAEPDPIAPTRYTTEDDGLSQPWFGDVFVNPPFSEIGDWVEKAYDEYRNGDADRVVLLLPVRLDTGYFHDYVAEADALCFLRGRVNYYDETGARRQSTFGSYLALFGPTDGFLDVFESLGTVITPSQVYESTTQSRLATNH